ncbi:MAG: hypothetical protein NW206_17610 [Hyphomonadaceae bacterium]|nr:hypothetical protein [Hyphomonadaceae bacterium]
MRILFVSGLALASMFAVAAPADATSASDRAAAIQVCREEVGRQAGVEPDTIRLDQVRARGRGFRVDLDLWQGGQLTNVRCETAGGDSQVVANITPALTTETASN